MTVEHGQPRVLLMGANGRVGRLLLRSFADIGGMSLLTHARRGDHDLVWDPIDEPPVAFRNFLTTSDPIDALFLFFGPGSYATPAEFEASNSATLTALDVALEAQIPRILVASSSAVYGLGQDLGEDDPLAPAAPYGVSKCDLETAVSARDFGASDVTLLRIGNVAGADALLAQVEPNMPTIPIDRFPDEHGPIRSFISPRMLAHMLLNLSVQATNLPPILNIGAMPPVDMADLAKAAKLEWHWRDAPTEKAPYQRITLDCTRLAEIVGRENLETSPEAIIADLVNIGALA